jgi:hypothetical protein
LSFLAGVILRPGQLLQCTESDMLAQSSIDFESSFMKELIGGGLMRKAGVGATISFDIFILVAGKRRLDIQQLADLLLVVFALAVIDGAYCPV